LIDRIPTRLAIQRARELFPETSSYAEAVRGGRNTNWHQHRGTHWNNQQLQACGHTDGEARSRGQLCAGDVPSSIPTIQGRRREREGEDLPEKTNKERERWMPRWHGSVITVATIGMELDTASDCGTVPFETSCTLTEQRQHLYRKLRDEPRQSSYSELKEECQEPQRGAQGALYLIDPAE
jgi:hypothetical protein